MCSSLLPISTWANRGPCDDAGLSEMRTLLLVRHAASTGPAPDAPLSLAGEAQAHALVPHLAAWAPTDLFSSPYVRAKSTLAPFATATGSDVIVIDALRERRLSHRDLPDWQEHIARSFAEHDYAPEGGESLRAVHARALSAIATIWTAAKGTRPAAASHGGWISTVLHTIDPGFGYAEWKNLGNPDLFQLIFDDQTPSAFHRLSLE